METGSDVMPAEPSAPAHNSDRKAYSKAWRERNRDKVRKYLKAYYEANKDRLKAYVLAWRKANPLKVSEYERRSFLKNPTRKKQQKRLSLISYRARRRGAEGKICGKDILVLLESQSARCAYCRVEFESDFHIEHRIPLIRGGTNRPDNICLACPNCNYRKHTLTAEEFLAKRTQEAGPQ